MLAHLGVNLPKCRCPMPYLQKEGRKKSCWQLMYISCLRTLMTVKPYILTGDLMRAKVLYVYPCWWSNVIHLCETDFVCDSICIYVMFYMRGIALLCCSKLMVIAMMSFYIMCIPMQVFVLWVGMWVGESLKNTLILCSLNDCFAVLYWRVVQHWLCLSSFSSRCPFIIAGWLSIEPS